MRPAPLLAIVAFAIALAVPAPARAADTDTAAAWQSRGDAATGVSDWPAGRQAYERAVAAAVAARDDEAEALTRRKLAGVLVRIGDREAALGEYDALHAFYSRNSDVVSASVAGLLATMIALDLDRFDDVVRRVSDYVRTTDADAVRRGVMERLRVSAHVRAGRTDEAKRAALAARETLPPAMWDRYLREEVVRLGAWSPDDAPTRWLPIAVAVLVGAIVLAAVVFRRRRAEIAMAGAVVLVTLGLAELALRMLMPSTGEVRHLLHAPNLATTFRPEPGVMPGIDVAETRFTTNAIGLRGAELPADATPRWLAVGGSSTESLFLDDDVAWPAVVERELRETHGKRIWLGNGGKSGLTTFSHVSQLRAWADEIRPSVVIMQSGFNDMSLCISEGRADVRDTARRFRWPDAQDGYGTNVFHTILPPRASSRWRLEELVDRAVAGFRTSAATQGTVRSFVVQDRAGRFYEELRRRRKVADKVDAVPDIAECVASFAENLRRIADWASERRVKLVLLTQGSMYRPDLTPGEEHLLWFGSVERSFFDEPPPTRYYAAGVMRELLGRYNAVTLALCAERKLACFDVDTFVPQTSLMYYDDAHVNVRGSRTLGTELAKRLAAAGL